MDNPLTPLERGLAVLASFSAAQPELTIREISRKIGIPYSAAFRCIHTLEKMGLIEKNRQGLCVTTRKTLELASGYSKLKSPRPAARGLI